MNNWNAISALAVAICIAPVTAPAQDQGSPESGASETVQIGAEDQVSAYIASKGKDWAPGNKKGRIVASGIGMILAKPGRRGYLQARSIAFTKAMLEAKKEMVTFLGQEISREITASVLEPPETQEAASEDPQSPDPSIFDKATMLMHSELNQLLEDRGIDPTANSEEAAREVKKLIQETRFSDTIAATARNEVAGLTAYKIFECQPPGEQGEIGVICLSTKGTRKMASALLGKGKPATKAAKKPLIEQLPSKDQIACTYGVQVRINEHGDICLVSFGHGIPRTKSRSSMNIAKKKAKLLADGEIRSFAGELVGVSSSLDRAESFQELEDSAGQASDVYSSEEAYEETTKAVAASLKISGITTLKRWELDSPYSDGKFVIVCRVWSPASADQANLLRNTLAALSGSKGGTGRTTTVPAGGSSDSSGSGSGPTGGSGYGEGQEGDDDALD